MSRNWTAAQRAAMSIHDKTLLVSAAAGSGKTATLTERIIRSITNTESPADISKMLIVTFTKAAAEELKSRITSAISDAMAKDPTNRHLSNQLIKLVSAKICTIDAFYLEIVRANFSSLGLPASLRVADPAELEILSKRVMEDIIESFYDSDEEFTSFAECFTGTRSADKLAEVLLDLDIRVASIPEGVEFLKMSALQLQAFSDSKTDFFATPFGHIIRDSAKDTIEHILSVYSAACEYFENDEHMSACLLPSFEYDKHFCMSLIETLGDKENGYCRTRSLLSEFSPITLKRMKPEFATDESDAFKEMRTGFNKQIRDLAKSTFSKEPDTIFRAMADTARYVNKLYLILCAYEEKMSEEKLRRSILDFNDIRRYALRLLVNSDGTPTGVARQYAEQFSDIYIDEYQDVDRVQDLIFRAIAKPDNRFMVGDIKQSIYSFRGAEPQVFAEYRSRFPDHNDTAASDSDGATVFMSENFRCDKNIIDFTNLVCSRIFLACADSIDYRPSDDLVFAKPQENEDVVSPAVNVSVLITAKTSASEDETDDETDTDKVNEAIDKREAEAQFIATEIQRLISVEKKANGKPILPGDIAVLFRARSMSAYVSRALSERGILSSESDGDRYFEDPEVLMVLCLLNTIDNPHRDIFLTGTLRSPIFGFSLEDIIIIRSACDRSFSLYDALLAYCDEKDELAQRCRQFEATLDQLRQSASALPVDRFLRILFESDIFVSCGLLGEPDESGNGGNLLRLYEYARTFESGSFKGLYNFIEFINSIIEEDKKMKIPPKGVSPDRVNLMTIHQSKGLEFPVCFICDTAKRFNRQDQKADLLFEHPTGVAMKISDSTGFARINTPMRDALAANIAVRQTEEEMRVLYVAMTRARERLYITASTSTPWEKLMRTAKMRVDFCDRYTILNCSSYLDWILLPFADSKLKTDCGMLSFFTSEEISDADIPESENISEQKHEDTVRADEALLEKLKADFAFKYPYLDLCKLPAKLSVSRLSPDALDETDSSVDLFEEGARSSVPDFFITGKPSRASSAERGTATHLFLQFCDFEYAKRYGVENEIARLVEKKFIPQNIADLIYIKEIEEFFRSDFVDEILSARSIIREQRFNLLLPADMFTQNEAFGAKIGDEQLAVQGVIDLVLIDKNGDIALYDYKTDRLSRQELEDPSLAKARMNLTHGLQLSYYAYAASLLFGREPTKICVYSTCAGKTFDIEKAPLCVPKDILDTL